MSQSKIDFLYFQNAQGEQEIFIPWLIKNDGSMYGIVSGEPFEYKYQPTESSASPFRYISLNEKKVQNLTQQTMNVIHKSRSKKYNLNNTQRANCNNSIGPFYSFMNTNKIIANEMDGLRKKGKNAMSAEDLQNERMIFRNIEKEIFIWSENEGIRKVNRLNNIARLWSVENENTFIYTAYDGGSQTSNVICDGQKRFVTDIHKACFKDISANGELVIGTAFNVLYKSIHKKDEERELRTNYDFYISLDQTESTNKKLDSKKIKIKDLSTNKPIDLWTLNEIPPLLDALKAYENNKDIKLIAEIYNNRPYDVKIYSNKFFKILPDKRILGALTINIQPQSNRPHRENIDLNKNSTTSTSLRGFISTLCEIVASCEENKHNDRPSSLNCLYIYDLKNSSYEILCYIYDEYEYCNVFPDKFITDACISNDENICFLNIKHEESGPRSTDQQYPITNTPYIWTRQTGVLKFEEFLKVIQTKETERQQFNNKSDITFTSISPNGYYICGFTEKFSWDQGFVKTGFSIDLTQFWEKMESEQKTSDLSIKTELRNQKQIEGKLKLQQLSDKKQDN